MFFLFWIIYFKIDQKYDRWARLAKLWYSVNPPRARAASKSHFAQYNGEFTDIFFRNSFRMNFVKKFNKKSLNFIKSHKIKLNRSYFAKGAENSMFEQQQYRIGGAFDEKSACSDESQPVQLGSRFYLTLRCWSVHAWTFLAFFNWN